MDKYWILGIIIVYTNHMKFVIANWKMNLSVEKSIALAKEYARLFKETPAEIVVCPSFTSLPFIGKMLANTSIAVGSQDIFWEKAGAFTGEISADDLVELEAGYVIIGHSERRTILGEEDWMINRKIRAALATPPLCPILCIGEGADDRAEGQRESVLTRQIAEALEGISLEEGQNLIVAYEPIWAIGTGEIPELDDIQYVMEIIRVLLRRKLGNMSDEACAVLYGGSVDGETGPRIARIPAVDGFLVGGASLKPREFYRIATSVVD